MFINSKKPSFRQYKHKLQHAELNIESINIYNNDNLLMNLETSVISEKSHTLAESDLASHE